MSIGKSAPMRDAVERVTGTLPYAANLVLADMLHARVLRSPVPYARILRVDAGAAAHLPGVAAVLTAADLDQPGGPQSMYGAFVKDQSVVARDRVRFIGEPVAVVAAESTEIAEAALALIDVEYDELPAVYDAQEAMQPNAPILHAAHPDNVLVHAKLRHGDIESGFALADEIVEETYTSPVAQHVSLEPHVSVAQWVDGRLTVWAGTQAPYVVQRVLAEMFGIAHDVVRVIVPPLGGSYGGKGHTRIEPLVAALAWKLGGRPVKLALTRAEEFVTVTKHAASITIKTGVKRDGTLTGSQITMHWNGGAYAVASPVLVRAGIVRATGPYRIPHVHVDSYGVYTNLPPAAAFRGAMASQATWAHESHMDTIAHRLGLDPLDFRLRNLLRDGDTFATGETMHDVHFEECLRTAAANLRWAEPPDARRSGTQRYGRGLAVMMKSTIPNSKSECRLTLDAEGGLTLLTSTVEMGQGAHTALGQIAATSVGVPLHAVTVVGPDTDITPFDAMTAASRSTNMMGNAILNGAEALQEQLRELAAPILEHPPEELTVAAGLVSVTADARQRIEYGEVLRRNNLDALEAHGEYATDEGWLDPETGQGVASPDWHQGAGACEVAVDTETGEVTVLRYQATSFAGRVVNPALVRLQNDGNVIYGLGPTLLEEMVFDDGQVINPNLSDYMIPSFLDTPSELHSVALESDDGEFHGIGEMTLPPVSPAIGNAIFDAVGVRIHDLPITAEKILRAMSGEQ